MKRCKSLISMCALAAMANCAKADIVSAQEQVDGNGNLKSIVLHDPTATIGSIKTPWIFSRPDGHSGFANDFTTNAISVVSEDGINYYAQVKDSVTNIIHFTLNQDGIPNKDGDIIHIPVDNLNEMNEMENRTLVGVTGGYLCFYPTNQYGTSLIYKPGDTQKFSDMDMEDPSVQAQIKCLGVCRDENGVLHALCNFKYTENGENKTKTVLETINGVSNQNRMFQRESFNPPFSETNRLVVAYKKLNRYYIGDLDGNVSLAVNEIDGTVSLTPKAKLPGPISAITVSNGSPDVFVTSPATNAFLNVGLPNGPSYNTVFVKNTGGKPMVPKTNDGLIRIIDNRQKGGKLMYVTKKGIHTFDD